MSTETESHEFIGWYEGYHRRDAEVERLRAALELVRTDPCFHLLGSVTHDTVTGTLGLTSIPANSSNERKPE
jgi:hypothetical protein